MKTIAQLRSRLAVALLAGACGALVPSAGCGGDNDYVRGGGSIDVPRPSGMITPEEAAAMTGEAPPANAAP